MVWIFEHSDPSVEQLPPVVFLNFSNYIWDHTSYAYNSFEWSPIISFVCLKRLGTNTLDACVTVNN
jgi:hypothetical protein